MVGIPKPHWTKPPSLVQFLSSPRGLKWCQCRHQMPSPKWTILDMWENSLCCTSPKQVRILCVGVNPSILLPTPTCQGGTLRSSSIRKLGNPKKIVCLTNWQLEGWQMIPWAYNLFLHSSHLGTGWVLGVQYAHLYVEPYHQVTGCCRNYN
jgi:hypothetical protein